MFLVELGALISVSWLTAVHIGPADVFATVGQAWLGLHGAPAVLGGATVRMVPLGLAGLVAAALVGGGSYYALQGKLGGSAGSSLDYVPADTLVFVGGLEPMSWSDLAAFRDSFSMGSKPEDMQKMVQDLLQAEGETPNCSLKHFEKYLGELNPSI